MTAAHGAVVLAAGASRRLGHAKQLIEIDGEPLVRRIARRVLATNPEDAVVVLAGDGDAVAAALAGIEMRTLRIADAHAGMSASLRAGIAALDSACAAALIALTDQPDVTVAHLRNLCASWRKVPGRAVASAYAGIVGVPALLPRSWFADVLALDGDAGARTLLRARREDVLAVPAPELARDIDSADDVRTL
jgi:molybdenum cofactor cytidylyltransferase